ncbi:hypothetical protein ACFWBF_34655 [Streptomyces sp. NPDC060028]|uniref:hypothetical protein n=1 Tax=Streptomyces sp. NPDC060028 TaxID=3347041 RepID=UPI00369D53B1
MAGGLLYGAHSPKGSTFRRYVGLLVVLAVALAALPAVHLAHQAGLPASWTLILLGTLLVLTSLPIAPAGAERFQLIGEMTAQQEMTQAFAGVGSSIAVGAAAGSAVAGLVADALGPAAALSLPAAFTALALLVSLAARAPITTALGPGEAEGTAHTTPHHRHRRVASMSTSPGVLAVVESQLSNFGLTPLRAAHELGLHTVLMSNDPDRAG